MMESPHTALHLPPPHHRSTKELLLLISIPVGAILLIFAALLVILSATPMTVTALMPTQAASNITVNMSVATPPPSPTPTEVPTSVPDPTQAFCATDTPYNSLCVHGYPPAPTVTPFPNCDDPGVGGGVLCRWQPTPALKMAGIHE